MTMKRPVGDAKTRGQTARTAVSNIDGIGGATGSRLGVNATSARIANSALPTPRAHIGKRKCVLPAG